MKPAFNAITATFVIGFKLDELSKVDKAYILHALLYESGIIAATRGTDAAEKIDAAYKAWNNSK